MLCLPWCPLPKARANGGSSRGAHGNANDAARSGLAHPSASSAPSSVTTSTLPRRIRPLSPQELLEGAEDTITITVPSHEALPLGSVSAPPRRISDRSSTIGSVSGDRLCSPRSWRGSVRRRKAEEAKKVEEAKKAEEAVGEKVGEEGVAEKGKGAAEVDGRAEARDVKPTAAELAAAEHSVTRTIPERTGAKTAGGTGKPVEGNAGGGNVESPTGAQAAHAKPPPLIVTGAQPAAAAVPRAAPHAAPAQPATDDAERAPRAASTSSIECLGPAPARTVSLVDLTGDVTGSEEETDDEVKVSEGAAPAVKVERAAS